MIFFLMNDPYYLSLWKRAILFSTIKIFSDQIHNLFTSIGIDQDIKDYVLSLLRVWKSNVKGNAPIGMDQQQLVANCALVILKRILLACSLFLNGNADTMFMKYMEELQPSVSDLGYMLKKAYETPQRRKSADVLKRLRSRLQKEKSIQPTTRPVLQQKQTPAQTVQQQQPQQQKQQKQQKIISRQSVSRLLQQVEQQVRKAQQQQEQQTRQTERQQAQPQPPFEFQYRSPGFHHRQTSQQDNRLLRQRKQQNIPYVQESLVNLPREIMETAREGKYSSILLVDVANKRRQFPTQQQMRSGLRKLIPVNIIAKARWKPLFVLVEQTDLDQSTIPKAVLDNSGLKSGILRVKVSCVKQTKDGRRTDCYKKQTRQQQFTKNPMDDFVLLTLQYALRSYYYKYMRHIGKDVNLLKKLESFRELVSNNPYQVFLQQQQLDEILRQSHPKVRFDQDLPYTWIISDDRWRDWARSKKVV
jgi:hypothetical protein